MFSTRSRVGLLFHLFFIILHYFTYIVRVDYRTKELISQKRPRKYLYTRIELSNNILIKCVEIVSVIKIRSWLLISHNRWIRFMDLTLTICIYIYSNYTIVAFGFYCIRISKFNDHLVCLLWMYTIVFIHDLIMPLSVVYIYICIISKNIFFIHIKDYVGHSDAHFKIKM